MNRGNNVRVMGQDLKELYRTNPEFDNDEANIDFHVQFTKEDSDGRYIKWDNILQVQAIATDRSNVTSRFTPEYFGDEVLKEFSFHHMIRDIHHLPYSVEVKTRVACKDDPRTWHVFSTIYDFDYRLGRIDYTKRWMKALGTEERI